MHYPADYIKYLAHFHGDRDFFECHEVLEEYWKSLPEREPIWVVLIQIAVGLYHHRRGNYGGAIKMLNSTFTRMTKADVERVGLDYHRLTEMIKQRIEAVEQGEAYFDLNLPISDPTLEELAEAECAAHGWSWFAPSSMEDALIHRHALRNRSDVIQARAEKLAANQRR
ncbi:hypothetical protein BEP19_16560 [Ammoniphilus oxalaticus]|uniref:DUF309 domain-containing protein n=1 Tax=Ammoniphilus oxalaticus TaxID=66863 RepID=A0A419SQY9_9BACL|nr:DUF309 domain-containing protein [Ammoniphilus oxalaticus]RKD26808.1 hypothetical protein BEP19_16560 [Ammoniphilus oxalaticus]